MAPTRAPGYAPPARFVSPSAPISTRNYPRPTYGNTYITNNTTIINNNYRYDSTHYSPHVAQFYGQQSPTWGNHWRYGCETPTLSIGVGFGFGFYVYTPYYAPCVPSPYYYDPCVPAYVPQARVVIWSGYSCGWDDGDSYDYIPGDTYDSYGDPQLNYGIYSISDCYWHRHTDDIVDFMGSGDIAIFCNGHYEYSLSYGDFRQMMADNCMATQTTGFEVLSVRHRGLIAVVRFRHRFRTHDGVHTVYMAYHMQHVGDRYAITDFMTSDSPM